MENKFRVNFKVGTEVPQEFFFHFFILSILQQDKTIPLSDMSVESINFLVGTKKLENEKDFTGYRFVSISQALREIPFDEAHLENLSDKDFCHEMRLRFEKAKIQSKQKLMSLFVLGNNETILEVYQDCLVRWSVPTIVKGKKERKTRQEYTSVLVGYCIAT